MAKTLEEMARECAEKFYDREKWLSNFEPEQRDLCLTIRDASIEQMVEAIVPFARSYCAQRLNEIASSTSSDVGDWLRRLAAEEESDAEQV